MARVFFVAASGQIPIRMAVKIDLHQSATAWALGKLANRSMSADLEGHLVGKLQDG
jgi:hypothetical protein